MSQPTPPPSPPTTPSAQSTTETIDDAAFDKILAQGKDIAAIGAVEATKALAAQLATVLQNKVAILVPKQTAAVAQSTAERQAAAAAARTTRNHALWSAIHTRPHNALWKPGQSDLPFLVDMISKVPGCHRCQTNAAAYLKSNPPDFTSADSYFAWTVGFHNSASLDAGHAPFTLAKALEAWPAT